MPVEEIMNLIWRAATFAGLAPANYLEAFFQLWPFIEGSFLRKELDGWDPEDDPWAEHVSHAKVDPWQLCFILTLLLLRGNVPLSTWERKQVN